MSAVKILADGSTSATNKRRLALPIISRISAFPRCPSVAPLSLSLTRTLSLCAHARTKFSTLVSSRRAKPFQFSPGKKVVKTSRGDRRVSTAQMLLTSPFHFDVSFPGEEELHALFSDERVISK